jgi:ubiquinone/menaquinone biosynthesis C-methylase UbiE
VEVERHFDAKADGYLGHVYLSGKTNCHVHNQQRRREYFRELIRLGSRGRGIALDVGSGPGVIAAELADCGFRTVGVDLSFKMLCNNGAHNGHRVRLAQCSADSLCFDDDCFDVVTAAGVLEYVPDDKRALGEIWRVLRPGGTLILSVPVGPSFLFTFARRHLRRWILKRDDERFHHSSYTPHQFRHRLQQTGFAVNTAISHHFVFFPADYLFPRLSIAADRLLGRCWERSRVFGRFGKTFVVRATKVGATE